MANVELFLSHTLLQCHKLLGDKIFSYHKQSADYTKQIVNMAEKIKKTLWTCLHVHELVYFYSTGEILLDLNTARQNIFPISEIQDLLY